MLVKLSDCFFLAAEQIASIKIEPGYGKVIVTDKNGKSYGAAPEHGESVFGALDRLVAQINTADCGSGDRSGISPSAAS